MGLTSVQVCMGMDTAEWLQGASHDEGRTESSSPSGDMITCSRPMVEKRLRPPQDQALKCPRCDSTHTKFCYYNNYSLSQPRYFCKTCRRYWTKGGSIRNIPVGGGCRKNKRVSVKKSSSNDQSPNPMHLNLSAHGATDLQLSFPEFQLSHFGNLLGNNGDLGNRAFTENKYNSMLEQPRQLDFMEYKYDNVLGNQRNYDFIGHTDLGLVGGLSDGPQLNFNGLCSPYGMSSFNGNGGNLMETCQRLMQPFDANEDSNELEMKPNIQLLSLDWQDQACSEVGKDSFGYFGGSWNGIMNG